MDRPTDDAREAVGKDGELCLERYAEVMAHLLHFGFAHESELLERLEINPDVWSSASRAHPSAIATASGSGRLDVAERFVDALSSTQRRLAAERPALSDIGPRATPAEDAAAAELDQGAGPAVERAPVPIAAPAVPVGPAAPRATSPGWPPAPAGRAALTETMPLDQALPALAAAVLAATQPRPAESGAVSTGTLPLDNDLSALAAAVTATSPPWIAMEKHACLCAELALDPTHASTVLERYGLTAQAKEQIDVHWRARFAVNPSLYPAWQKIYQETLARLRGAR